MEKKMDIDSLLSGIGIASNEASVNRLIEEAGAAVAIPDRLQNELPSQKILKGRVRSGESKNDRRIVEHLDPSICKPWKYYDRTSDWLNFDSCKDLILDIQKNGQEIPGIVRRLKNDKDGFEYEVVFGGRRHFAALYSNKEMGQSLTFKAVIQDISDEEAARLMDMENRNRADISGFERSVSYARMLGRVDGCDAIFKTQQQLLDKLMSDSETTLRKGTLSKMLTAAKLLHYEEVMSLLEGKRHQIPWTNAYSLVADLEDESISNDVLLHAIDKIRTDGKWKELDGLAVLQLIEKTAKEFQAQKSEGEHEGEGLKDNLPRSQEFELGGFKVHSKVSKKDVSLKIPKELLTKEHISELIELLKSALVED